VYKILVFFRAKELQTDLKELVLVELDLQVIFLLVFRIFEKVLEDIDNEIYVFAVDFPLRGEFENVNQGIFEVFEADDHLLLNYFVRHLVNVFKIEQRLSNNCGFLPQFLKNHFV
jgi:hypothetical protein